MLEIQTYLEQKVNKQVLLEDLIRQVEKDLQTTIDSTIILGSSTPKQLVEELFDLLSKVLNSSNVSRFSTLLYRVDVDENHIKNIQATDITEYLKQVIFLILKREIQKIYIKKNYRL
ncbi:hypothetical protein [Myroides sp. LJL119]